MNIQVTICKPHKSSNQYVRTYQSQHYETIKSSNYVNHISSTLVASS